MIFLFLAAYLAGILTAVITISYLFSDEKEHPKRHIIVDAKLPKSLEDAVKHPDGYQQKETCISLNFLLQFFFQERKFDITIHHFLTDLLNIEFAELLKHKTLSKIIQRIEIQNLSLGNNLPVVRSATPSLVKFAKDSSLLDVVHLDVDIEYTGGFDVTIDAYSRIAKKAIVKIKVEKLFGTARLLFSRQPFSHWGFTFYGEPEVKFDIQSSVLGHHIPKFRSIISKQLRSLIKRKYVIPYYKMRKRPLLKDVDPEAVPEAGVVIGGKVNLCLVKFSRLQESLTGTSMWCTFSICESAVVCAYELHKEVWAVFDVEIVKSPPLPIGFVLKSGTDFQVVDSIIAQSPAFQAGIKKGDFVVGVNGQPETGVQTGRLITDAWNREGDPTVIVRVKRFVTSNKKSSSDQLIGKDDISMDNGSYEKLADEGFQRKDSKPETVSFEETTSEENTSLESVTKALPTEEKDPHADEKGENEESEKGSQHNLGELSHDRSSRETKSEDKLTDSLPASLDAKAEFKYIVRRLPYRSRPILKYFESSSFDSGSSSSVNAQCDVALDEDCKFINVCLWSRGTKPRGSAEKSPARERRGLRSRQPSQDVRTTPEEWDDYGTLVGWVNFSVETLISEASLNTLGHVVKVAYLKPANPLCPAVVDHPLATHKGFDGEQCYGDVTLSVLHTPAFGSDVKEPACHSDDDYLSDGSVSDEDNESVVGQDREHVFKRTHFSFATHCDFCSKKIWLKDAVQCSVCGIICHKKCMARCRQATACDLGGLRYKEIRDLAGSDMPEIIMPDEDEEPVRRNSQVQTSKHSLGALLNHVGSATGSYISGSGLKRTGSAHNLAPPLNADGSSLSRSLPPSPLHSPRHSRKASLNENPFVMDFPADNMERFLLKSLERVLSYPHVDYLHHLAKQAAAGLLCQYGDEERAFKIELAVDILQKWIGEEGLTRQCLANKEKESDAIERARLALLIAECDSRTQAMALISMQYYNAQQLMAEKTNEVPKEN